MRVLLAISVIYHVTTAQKIGINVPCNKELDGLLTADPDGDDRAFMSCQSVGVGNIGFWERKLCPNNMIFDFINQQCKDISKKARKPQQLNIAILNNSCAKGETCIGGSVCDLDSLKCMCPYGTIPKLDTLSCESNEPPFVSATVDGPSQFFNSLSGPNRNNGGFFPFSSNTNSPDFSPNTNGFKFNNFENQNSNNNENNNFKWNPNFSWQNGNSYNNNNNGGSGVGGANQQPINNMNGPSPSDISNSFQPNPSQAQKFVFNFNKNTLSGVSNNNNNNNPIPEIKPKITTLAPPGASCKSNEICIGGSICTLPIGICLCPGDLEARDGECVLPAASTIAVSKVGIGALCSDLAECDHGSICVMGRCTCVSPLIQHEGKCVLRQQQKVVGPGELCDNGEICGKGSVCDVMIPVCVCPSHTDLSMGECVQVTATVTHSVMTPPPTLPPVQTAPPPTRPQQVVPTLIQTPPVKQPEVVTYSPKTSATIHSFYTSPPSTQYVPKHIYTAPPQLKPSVKVNQMKIGGSKQAGVGVRCSLNTDCMIGAYCNGNTNPPSCQCLSTHVNIEGRCEKVIYPGQVGCRSDLQCHAAYTGTHCIDRICMCPEGQKAVDQTCVSDTSLPNKSCGYSANPCFAQSVCYQKMCTCPDSFVFNSSTNNCDVIYPRKQSKCLKACKFPYTCINDMCICPDNVDCSKKTIVRRQTELYCSQNSDICKSKNAVCIDNICKCPEGFHNLNDECVSNYNSKNCDNTFPCPADYVCRNGKCHCEFEAYDKNGNCLGSINGAFKSIHNQCSSKDRCAGGAKCNDKVCQCVDGSIEQSGKCKQFPGGYCSNGEMCSGGSSCYLGICRCDLSRTLDNQRCVMTTVAVGEACRRGQTCINGSACRFGICMCVGKTIAVLGRCVTQNDIATTVIRKVEPSEIFEKINQRLPGMPCSFKNQCIGGSKCFDGICQCDADYEIISNKCWKNSDQHPNNELSTKQINKINNDQCEDDKLCGTNAKCVNGLCNCVDGFSMIDGNCTQSKLTFSSKPFSSSPGILSKAAPGELCKTSNECSFRSKCVGGVCRCKKGETIIESTCRTAIHQVLPGSKCDPSNGYDCVNESTCQYGVCRCRSRLISDGEQCVPENVAFQVFPGKSCANGEKCGGGSKCSKDNICRCPNDQVPDVNKKCVKKKNAIAVFNKPPMVLTSTTLPFILQTTKTPPPIYVDYTNFEKKLNELEKAEIQLKNTVPSLLSSANFEKSTILAGHQCQQNSECPAFSFCFSNVCHCMSGFKATAGFCEPSVAFGDSCISSNQCVENGECLHGRCICIPSDRTSCSNTKMAHPGEDCTSKGVVCSYNSYCSLMSGVCECPSGMATKLRKCENTFESIGNDCVTSRNCQKFSYCDNGFCVCKKENNQSDVLCQAQSNSNNMKMAQSFSIPFDKNTGDNTPLQNNLKYEFTEIQTNANNKLFGTTTKWPETLSFNLPTPSEPNFSQTFASFPIAYGAKVVAENENNSTIKYKMAFPGEYCGSGEVCLGNSVCKNHFCRCLQDVTAENGMCPPQINDLSMLGLHPLFPSTKYREELRFHPSNRGKKTEFKRNFSFPLENCQNGEQCMRNSTCKNVGGLGKICQCVNDTVFLDNQCVELNESMELVLIGDECNDHSICTSGSNCIDGKCDCGEEKQKILGICVTTSGPESTCANGEVCVNGSVCNEEMICKCPTGSYEDKGNCVNTLMDEEKSSISSNSQEDDDYTEIMNLQKIQKDDESEEIEEDQSKKNQIQNDDELYNLPSESSNILKKLVRRELSSIKCITDMECSSNFRCLNYICTCDKSTEECLTEILQTNKQKVTPGSSCDSNRQCDFDSICYKNNCVCSYEDIPIDDHCVAKDWNLPVGYQCNRQTHCQEDLQCIGGVCMCKFGDLKCNSSEPVTSPPGGSCSNLRECTGGSVCREGWCICPDSSMIVNKGICIQSGSKPTLPPKTIAPQINSASNTNMNAPRVTMPKSQTFVTEGPHGKKIAPGGNCGPLDSCVGNSNCIEGYCLCPVGQQPGSNGRCEKMTTTTRLTTKTTKTPGTIRPFTTYPPSTTTMTTTTTTAKPQTNQMTPFTTQIFTVAELFTTRRQPAFIEIPTHATLTSTVAAPINNDECTAIGLICKGNTVCRNKSCQCPDGYVLHHDGCISPEEAARRKARNKARHEASTAKVYSKPGENCAVEQICVGGSQCSVRNICECPQEKPELLNGQCSSPKKVEVVPGASCNQNSICIRGSSCESGLCRCQPGFIAVSGNCVALPMPTTPKMKTIAKPLESCENGETCNGGSSCDDDTGICMCPPGEIVFNVQCMLPPTQAPTTKKMESLSTKSTSRSPFRTDCEKDSNCAENKICVSGKCKCKPGFVDNSGRCEPLEDIDVIERPIPVSYAKHKVATFSDRLLPKEEIHLTNIEVETPTQPPAVTPARQETQKPRVVGPPIRRPKPKNKNSGGGSGSGRSGSGSRSYKTGNGNGNCPPGNDPTKDNSGKRTRMLKYGQACDRYQDKCTNGAKCIDNVCKCGTGFLLSSSGWCEGFVLEKAIENNKKIMKTTTMSSSKAIALTESKKVFSSQVTQEPEPFPTPPSSIFGFTKKSSTKRVPKVAAVGSSCEPIDVCLNSSICQSGYCQCPKNFILQNGQCISRKTKHKVAKVGGTCKNGEICSGGSICDSDQKKCICAAQHIAIKGICKLKSAPSFAAPGSTCSMGEKCTGGSSCVHGMCSCDEKHFAEDGYCRPIEVRSSPIQFINGAGLRFSSKAVPPRSRAQPCNENECKLPNCFCSSDGRQIPGGLKLDETPQFVVLTFDDAVNGKTFPDYKELFENDILKNPNGCDVKATFFISHEWTNYDAVGWLVQKKMEIASNSISHVSLEHESTNRWLNEMDGQRRILAKFGGVPEEEIYGIRAPQLALGGDRQFEMMAGANFLYDNSMSANPGVHGDPFWPQTLDYQVAWSCYEDSCPKSSFPGIWSVPLNQFYGAYMRQIDSFKRSSMIRAAVDLNNTVDELESIIMRNFERSYSSNRAPFVLSLNADFLQLNGKKNGMKALKKFLNRMRVQKDVYMVTIKQLIDWMKRPVPLSQMHKSKAVGCPVTMAFHQNPTAQTTCLKPNKCLYNTPSLSSQEHQFLTCLPCPTMYPWLENPSGAIV